MKTSLSFRAWVILYVSFSLIISVGVSLFWYRRIDPSFLNSLPLLPLLLPILPILPLLPLLHESWLNDLHPQTLHEGPDPLKPMIHASPEAKRNPKRS